MDVQHAGTVGMSAPASIAVRVPRRRVRRPDTARVVEAYTALPGLPADDAGKEDASALPRQWDATVSHRVQLLLADARAVLSIVQQATTDEGTWREGVFEDLQGALQVVSRDIRRALAIYGETPASPTEGWFSIYQASGIVAVFEDACWQTMSDQRIERLCLDDLNACARIAADLLTLAATELDRATVACRASQSAGTP